VETFADISEISRLDQEVDKLARQLDVDGGFQGMIGKSEAMHKVFDVIRKVAISEALVIVVPARSLQRWHSTVSDAVKTARLHNSTAPL
jgi:hypothetical protein